MLGRRIPLFKVLGIQINIDLSWFLIAILITWSLADGLFPSLFEGLSAAVYWVMGAAGAIGLFVSIVLHELGHAVVARRQGIPMRGITLFIFGGVAEMGDEPPSAKAEFLVAIAGPIVSVALAGVMFAAFLAANAAGASDPVRGVLGYLGWINAILVAFNMIPAFPLDGGRVLRAILWHTRGDLRWATRVTSTIGGIFGLALIAVGIVTALAGNIIGGIWWVVLGLFLRSAAGMSYQQLLLRRALEGEPVSRFMRANPVTVPPDLTLERLVREVAYTHHHKMYPVVEGGRLLGCITINDIKQIPRDRWETSTVGDALTACTGDNTVSPGEDAMMALSRLRRTGASRLMVVENGSLAGILSLKDLMAFLAMKVDLEGG